MNIRNIKYKIEILLNINKLTNTMSMISFSKMNKFHKKCKILQNLYIEIKHIALEIFKYKKTNKFCIILITTNKGFCGNMNNESIKFLLKFLKFNKNLDIIIIGKKAIDFFNKKNIFIKKKILFDENNIEFNNNILNLLKNYKNVFFISTKLINGVAKTIKTDLYVNKKKNFFEKKNINFDFLNSKYINYTLKYLYQENYFCELKLRMITMKSAADNSKKIIKDMNLLKNKIRQFKVTQDMLEIINGSNL